LRVRGYDFSTQQARLARLIRQAGTALIVLNGLDATAVGLLWRAVDVVVVICARRAGQAIVTSDAGGLRRLAPNLQFVAV
jgi:hypothetical protein